MQATLKRTAKSRFGGRTLTVSFTIKNELPQIIAAPNSASFAKRFCVFDIADGIPLVTNLAINIHTKSIIAFGRQNCNLFYIFCRRLLLRAELILFFYLQLWADLYIMIHKDVIV